MMNIKVNFLTWFFLLASFLCGFINYSLIIYMIIIFHEFGHIITIKLFKYKINKIEIYPFGGIINIEKDLNTPVYKELLIAISGIAMQMLLFIVMFYILSSKNYLIFKKYNISIIFFNLLPIIPLDGSIILNAILNKFFSFKKSLTITGIVSIIMTIFYLFFNYWYSINNYFIIALFIFKTYSYFKNNKNIYNKFLLERYLNNYHFKYLSLKQGSLEILKINTYQYFKENNKIISEKEKLKKRFNN